MRVRIVAASVAALLALTAGATAATAAPATATGTPVGGPLLGATGVVERPLPGSPALPPPSALPASSWLVANLATGQVLAAKNPHGKYLPASTLKVLTAQTLLPKLNPLQRVPVSYRDATVDGSRVGLVPSMKYTIGKLFTCMLVVSANDAADALAEANGGVRRTVSEMNAEARRLQADDTFARTPSGLDGPGESSSAYDLALIARAALAQPAFRRYVGTVKSTVPAPHGKHFQIYTHNQLLTTYRGDIGVKNGYTVAAEGTYIGAATRHGQTILVTLMHGNPNFWPMARALLNWGFAASGRVQPVGTLVGPLPPAGRATAAGAQHVLTSGAFVPAKRGGVPWLPMELVVAALVVVTFVGGLVRRRRARRYRYRPRLRLPPV